MKKSMTKLSLSRETLRSLDDSRLKVHQVQGGGTLACGESMAFSCDPISVAICPGSRRVC